MNLKKKRNGPGGTGPYRAWRLNELDGDDSWVVEGTPIEPMLSGAIVIVLLNKNRLKSDAYLGKTRLFLRENSFSEW
jgi:hypothetical protein